MTDVGSKKVERVPVWKRVARFRAAAGWLLLGLLVLVVAYRSRFDARQELPPDRREVVFWHFWGGKDRRVVEKIVDQFNASQTVHFVRAIAMPGNNVDLKLFLGVAGEKPPDVVNQDDPIVADWASRGALLPLDELGSPAEVAALDTWLFPAARAIGSYRNRLYALCNGLDIRALYYDERVLDEYGLVPPRTLAELDAIAQRITPPPSRSPVAGPPGADKPIERYGFLPDPRRIWAWGIVFGGRFYDPASGRITSDSEPIVRACQWMASYGERYGYEQVIRYRKADQALPGAAFPLLEKRYALVMDGQWRVAEVAAAAVVARRRGQPEPRVGVVPLPPPPGGLERSGWVNGNFFVVPRGGRNPAGAWQFMKFWSGLAGHAADAARTCAAGGWIPAAQEVVNQSVFQDYLRDYPLFRTFVDLAASPNQVPTPAIPGAQYFQDEISRAAEDAMAGRLSPRAALEDATRRVRARLNDLAAELP